MRTLADWQNWAYIQFREPSIGSIGEIPIDAESVEQVLDLIRDELGVVGGNNGEWSRRLTRDYRHIFAIALTQFEMRNPEFAFWAELAKRLNTNTGTFTNYGWGPKYLEFVRTCDFVYFTGADTTIQYVTTLRLQGGVPGYAFEDLYTEYILPSIDHKTYRQMQDGQALKSILAGNPLGSITIKNFFNYGGDKAEEYFAEWRRLVRLYRAKKELPSYGSTNLPEFVVDRMVALLTEDDKESLAGYQQPYVTLEPNQEPYLFINLPSQPVPNIWARAAYRWEMKGDKKETEICETGIQTIGGGYQTRAMLGIPIEGLAKQVRVEFIRLDGDEANTLRSWQIDIFPRVDQLPMMAFNGRNRKNAISLELLSSQRQVPAGLITLLLPKDALVKCSNSRLDYTHPPLGGGLEGWKAEDWDLSEALYLQIERGGDALPGGRTISGKVIQPEVYGDDSQPIVDPSGMRVFSGKMPFLRVPVREGRNLANELDLWSLKVRDTSGLNQAVEDINLAGRIGDFTRLDQDYLMVEVATLLDSHATGVHNLTLRRKWDRDYDISFRLLPDIRILDMPNVILPRDNEDGSLTFHLSVPDGYTLSSTQPHNQRVTKFSQTWEVHLADGVDQAELSLNHNAKPGQHNFWVPVPRLKWNVYIGDKDIGRGFGSELLYRSVQDVLAATDPGLTLQMPGLYKRIRNADLVLRSADGLGDQLQEIKIKIAEKAQAVNAALKVFSTTLAGSQSIALFELCLRYWEDGKGHVVPLVALDREMAVQDVSLTRMGENYQLKWKEEYQLKNRRVVLTPVWKPWLTSREFKIPDDRNGNLEIPSGLVEDNGYSIFFYVAKPFAPPRKALPRERSIDCWLIEPNQTLAAVGSGSDPLSRFYADFERAAIKKEICSDNSAETDALYQLTKGEVIPDLRLLFAYYDWLGAQPSESPNRDAFKTAIFSTKQIQWFLDQYVPADPLHRRYLELFKLAKFVKNESLQLVLAGVDDSDVIEYCLAALIAKKNNKGGLGTSALLHITKTLVETQRLTGETASLAFAKIWDEAFAILMRDQELRSCVTLVQGFLRVKPIEFALVNPIYGMEEWKFFFANETNHGERRKAFQRIWDNDAEVAVIEAYQVWAEDRLETSFLVDLLENDLPFAYAFIQEDGRIRDRREELIREIIALHEELDGTLVQGHYLRTPFGTAKISRILSRGNGPLDRVKISTGLNERLMLDFIDAEEGEYNFSTKTLRMGTERNLRKCVYCRRFVSGNSRLSNAHFNNKHPNEQFLSVEMIPNDRKTELSELTPLGKKIKLGV